MFVYLQNVKNPSIRFKVLEFDKETKVGKLEGSFGVKFSRNISKQELDRLGYTVVKSEEELPLTPPPASPTKKRAAVTEDE